MKNQNLILSLARKTLVLGYLIAAMQGINVSAEDKSQSYNTSPDLNSAIDTIKSHPESLRAIHSLKRYKDPRAVSALRGAFSACPEKVGKQAIASALIAMGDQNRVYKDMLVSEANDAISKSGPFPIDVSHKLRKGFSPKFVLWAQAHNIDVSTAAATAIYSQPQNILFLSLAESRDFKPLLLNGLKSENYLIAYYSAQGLARLKDNSTVPAIIEACKNSPPDIAALIARTLLLFDDPQANDAADTFISNKSVLNFFKSQDKLMRRKLILGE